MPSTVVHKENYHGSILSPLLELSDCPKQMYAQGPLPNDGSKILTIVGSRRHSPYAKQALAHLMKGLTGSDTVIVSGLALGIDALAHRYALEYGLRTIAVPGSGLDPTVLYPASNRRLARKILERNGCLLSELQDDIKAAPWTFPMRNRIMARMADLVLVVEAASKSGTLITARNASEYGVDVAVVPNGIFSASAEGSNNLIKEGAHIVTDTQDIFDLIGIEKNTQQENKEYTGVSKAELIILTALTEPLSRADLLARVPFDTVSLSQYLSLLEIQGHIREEQGLLYRT